MKADITIIVARDYATHPIGREAHLWPFSGERFRTQFLEQPLGDGQVVCVDLRGTRGLAPSFLEEAFGGLIDAGFTEEFLRKNLQIKADDQARVDQVWGYVRTAAKLRQMKA